MFSAPPPDPHLPPLGLSADEALPRPIGPERLRALREAILNGTYPLDAAVVSGLSTLFRGDAVAAESRAVEGAPPPRASDLSS